MSRPKWKPTFLDSVITLGLSNDQRVLYSDSSANRAAEPVKTIALLSSRIVLKNPKDTFFASKETVCTKRSTQVLSSRVGRRFQIYNGLRFFSVEVTPERIGHRFGEFAPTRRLTRPSDKKRKRQKGKKL